MLSVTAFVTIFFSRYIGRLSDRVGRKRPILIGTALALLTLALQEFVWVARRFAG